MAEQTSDRPSERVRYTDSSGQRWHGTLSIESSATRHIRFELESEEDILGRDTGKRVASEIEDSNWLKLRGEKGRYLQLARPLITYVPHWPAMDQHGSHPVVLRGIAHDLFESRFALNPEETQVSKIWFSSNSALYVLGERLQDIVHYERVSMRPDQKHDHDIKGLGRVSFHLAAMSSLERHTTTISDRCSVSIMPDAPMTLEEAQRAFHLLALFLDFLFGQPTELPTATLVTKQGNVTLLGGGNPYASKLDTSGMATAIQIRAASDGATAHFGQAEFGATLQTFWDNREKLIQPMNVALRVLHVNDDMLWRLFATLPTLEKFLPTSVRDAGSNDMIAASEEFFQYVQKNEAAWDFCCHHMTLLETAKPPSFAMKLTSVVELMRVAGWSLPHGTEKNIKVLRNSLAHTATTQDTPFDQLWPILTAAASILIYLICETLGIPLGLVVTHRGSNFRAIGQVLET